MNTIVSAAALATATPLALAGEDPSLAMVTASKAAYANLEAACENEPPPRSPEHAAWKAAHDSAGDAHTATQHDMLQTVPTTHRGALAMVDHFLETDGVLIDEESSMLLESLQAFLRTQTQ